MKLEWMVNECNIRMNGVYVKDENMPRTQHNNKNS